MGKNVSSKYEQKLLDTTSNSAIDALKTTSKKSSKTRQTQVVIQQEITLQKKLRVLHHKRLQINPQHPQRSRHTNEAPMEIPRQKYKKKVMNSDDYNNYYRSKIWSIRKS